MVITQKCQYALRAIFELARRQGSGPVKIVEVAESQAIPPRFLENILNQLKQGGFVESRRGKEGGYLLARPAESILIGEIIRFIQGPICPVDCCVGGTDQDCPFLGDCVFQPLWQRVKHALEGVYDSTTFADLVRADRERLEVRHLSYTI